MKKALYLVYIILGIFLVAVLIVMSMKSCDTTPETNVMKKQAIDTMAMINKINAYEIQPIDRIEIFQVYNGKYFCKEFGSNCRRCLAKTYKFNKKKKSSWNDGYEKVNRSAMIYVFDESIMLYDALEITASDYIMVGTYTYDTKPENLFGMEIPSETLTVPVYVRKSELLELYQ